MAIRSLAIFTAMVAFMLPAQVQGQERELRIPTGHLKKANPNELYVVYNQEDDCTGTYETVVENELVQARIKRISRTVFNEIYMVVDVDCLQLSDDDYQVYVLRVQFGIDTPITNPNPNEFPFSISYYQGGGAQYTFGVSPTAKETITNSLRRLVEASLADYLKANFDL